MTSVREHLNRVWNDNDPLDYFAQHGDEVFEALEAEKNAVDRWGTLKNVLVSMSSRTELISDKDTYYTCDQQWGFDEALSRVENIIERLENEK